MIFYNLPARIHLDEFTIDMPCLPETYFANDADTCQQFALSELEFHPPPMDNLMLHYLGHRPEADSSTKSFTAIYFFVLVNGMYELLALRQ